MVWRLRDDNSASAAFRPWRRSVPDCGCVTTGTAGGRLARAGWCALIADATVRLSSGETAEFRAENSIMMSLGWRSLRFLFSFTYIILKLHQNYLVELVK